MDINSIRQTHSVRVCEGSGVLVKPLSSDFLYILTDNHVIEGKKTEEITFIFDKDSPLVGFSPEIIEIANDKSLDVSIIKIKSINFEKVEYLRTKTTKVSHELFHVGFPKSRYNDDAISKTSILHIIHTDGIVQKHLVEYEYEKVPKKEELEGMSGGGIFDSEYNLVGLHKQSSNLDKNEFLGKAAYIPISDFRIALSENNWSPILEFDLNSFSSFNKMIFNFEDQGYINKMVTNLLLEIDKYKERLENVSPKNVINLLKDKNRISSDIFINELNKEFWIAFSEFIIGILIILDIDEKQDDFIIKVYDKFHFVYSNTKFDVYDTREKLDINLIKGMCKGSKLVIGGLSDCFCLNGNILPCANIVPSISSAQFYDERDISRSNRRLLSTMTIINSKIFKAVVGECANNNNDSLEYYKQLLINKIA